MSDWCREAVKDGQTYQLRYLHLTLALLLNQQRRLTIPKNSLICIHFPASDPVILDIGVEGQPPSANPSFRLSWHVQQMLMVVGSAIAVHHD